MKKHALPMLLALLPCAAAGLEPSQVFDKVSPSVWIVRTFDANERPMGQGSAVVIGAGKLVTNCHVLAKSKQVMVRRRNVMYEAKLEHADAPRDLCILQVEGFGAPAVAMRKVAEVKVGEKVFAIGNPRGLEVTLSEGLVSGLRGEWADGSHVVQTTAPISPGSSGGGLFDEEGRLVGITTFQRRDSQNLNFALPSDWIGQVPERSEAALAKRNAPRQAAAAAPGAPMANVPPGYPAPGTVWLYRFTERGGYSRRSTDVTVRADRVDQDLIDESLFVGGGGAEAPRRTIQTKDSRFLHYKLGGEAVFLEIAPYLVAVNDGKGPDNVDASGYPISGQVFAGDTRLNFTTRVRPRDWEDVTVPAGSYRALRYEIDGDREASASGFVRAGATTRFKVNVWYAPDVQRIVKVEHKAWTNSATPYTDDSVELLEYRPPR
jgi:serine protease Do